jgi:HEAT repeat protein
MAVADTPPAPVPAEPRLPRLSVSGSSGEASPGPAPATGLEPELPSTDAGVGAIPAELRPRLEAIAGFATRDIREDAAAAGELLGHVEAVVTHAGASDTLRRAMLPTLERLAWLPTSREELVDDEMSSDVATGRLEVRVKTVALLLALGADALPLLERLLDDPTVTDHCWRVAHTTTIADDALRCLTKIGAPAVPVVLRALGRKIGTERSSVALALGYFDPPGLAADAIPALTELLDAPDSWTRHVANASISRIRGGKAD